jgi:hypothetical protein
VLVVAVLFAVVLVGHLDTYHGNATGFVLFGRHFVPYIHPPHGARIGSEFGYDGQFFYLQAKDPLALKDSTIAGFRGANEVFRLQRVAYPALAYILAAGQRSAIPWSMLAINLLVVLAATGGFAVYARRRGWPGWWALGVGLLAGLLTGTLRDLSDPLAVASMLAGLVLWQRRRRWGAAAALTLAVLAREPMMLAVVSIGFAEAVGWWRGGRAHGAWREVVRKVWPPVLVPVLAFVAWQIYIDARYGGNAASTSGAFLPPFQGLIDEVRHAVDDPQRRDTAWELAYLGLMGAGILAAVSLVWQKITGPGVAALLFGLSLLVLVFGDPWSYTRLSAPMFAALLVAGLEQRNRPALVVCAAAAALTALVPFAPWLAAA